MRFNLLEFSGSLGDLGTFIPLAAAMSLVSGLDLGHILIFAGLFNITTGLLFGLPIPVQPMKAIAAVAIAEALAPPEIAAAGILAGGVVLISGWSGLVEKLNRLIPIAVVRGIQLGVGIKLALKGVEFVTELPAIALNSILTAIILAGGVLIVSRIQKFPTALALSVAGLAILVGSNGVTGISWTPVVATLSFNLPSSGDWLNGFLYGAIPQIPLTLLNSVIAVCLLSGDLFPERRVGVSRMAISVGVMNIVGCWFGAMPMCHGSGGLAGQYHFGARTGGSVVMLGIGKLLIGLFFFVPAAALLNAYPMSVLGLMLVLAGYELARPSRDQRGLSSMAVMSVTAAGIILVNTMVGFAIGFLLSLVLRWKKA